MIENVVYYTLILIIILGIIYKLLDYSLRIPRLAHDLNRYIFITGCDTGFGNLLAKRLDSKGCHVIAGCLTEKGETELRKVTSSRLKTVTLDVSKQDSIVKAYEFVKGYLPNGKGLWGLVNNAGIMGKLGPPWWMRREDYMEVLNVNTLGVTDVCSTFLPIVRQEKGRIVNMASVAGRVPVCHMCIYSVSKSCVESYSDSLRRYLKGSGVSVHILEPGGFATQIMSAESMLKNFRKTFETADPEIKLVNEKEYEEYLKGMNKRWMHRGLGNPDAVVGAYEHALLARYPRARYVVGQDATTRLFIQALPEWLSDYCLNALFPTYDSK